MRAVILGGTGTLGQALAMRLLSDLHHITCVSRCELKQKEMAKAFGNPPGLAFRLGDIRDKDAMKTLLAGADVVFHVAALKHIDVAEDNPEESVKTNIQGTMNVADAAIECGVPYVVFSSTDKAVDPINVYGMCKGISEKMLIRRNETQDVTKFIVYRWGNVLGSRGSALGSFVDQLKANQPVRLTHADMSRFWIRIESAVEFILSTFKSASGKEVMIPPMKAATVSNIIAALALLAGTPAYSTQIMGLRKGEKIHEDITSWESSKWMSSHTAPQYSDAELLELLRGMT